VSSHTEDCSLVVDHSSSCLLHPTLEAPERRTVSGASYDFLRRAQYDHVSELLLITLDPTV